MCLRAIALDRAYHTSKKTVESLPKNYPVWEGARGDEVQRVRIEPQQPRAVSPVAPPALGAAGGCDPGGAAVPSAKSNCIFTMAPARP